MNSTTVLGVLEERSRRTGTTIGRLQADIQGMVQSNLHAPDEVETADTQVANGNNGSILQVLTGLQGQIDHSIDRVKQGKHGVCERCGGKIEPKRLAALPYATVCCKCLGLKPVECEDPTAL